MSASVCACLRMRAEASGILGTLGLPPPRDLPLSLCLSSACVTTPGSPAFWFCFVFKVGSNPDPCACKMTILPTEPSPSTPFFSPVFSLFVKCHTQELDPSWVWLSTTVINMLRKLRQEDCEFEASLGYIVHLRSSPSKTQNKAPNYLWPSSTCLILLQTQETQQ